MVLIFGVYTISEGHFQAYGQVFFPACMYLYFLGFFMLRNSRSLRRY